MSDTNPLPAQTLLKLADRAIGGGCNNCCVWIPAVECVGERGNPCHVWNGHHCGTVDLDPHAEAYRAARAASPVTLEEALLREARQHLPGAIHTQDLRPCPECKTALRPSSKERCYKCFSVAIINARRLAGEGGAK